MKTIEYRVTCRGSCYGDFSDIDQAEYVRDKYSAREKIAKWEFHITKRTIIEEEIEL